MNFGFEEKYNNPKAFKKVQVCKLVFLGNYVNDMKYQLVLKMSNL